MVHPLIPLDAVRATAERVVRLAHAVYGGYGADVVWREGRRHSRTRPFRGDANRSFPSRHVMATGEPLWIENFDLDPVVKTQGLEVGSGQVKAFLGVPIVTDGKVLGALIAIDLEARPQSDKVLRHFQSLASLLGDDCARVKMASEVKAALEDSARSERRLRAALRIAKIRVWELDHARREAFSEQQQRDVVDYDQAMAKLWAPVHPDDLPEALAAWDAHVAGGPPIHVVHRHMRSDGATHWMESVAEAVRDEEDRVVGAVGAVRNIDQEKRNELDLIEARKAAESASEAKSVFLATVSHEIRTPLNGIYGMAQAMTRDHLPAGQRDRLDVICKSSESLLSIVNDVLDLSKISAGKLELEEIDFDLVELATGVLATFAALAAAKGLELRLQASPVLASRYRGDPGRLRQVLSNLVSNALKFTTTGEVVIALDHRAEGLSVSVTDTGTGIPLNRQAQIFDSFVQAETSTTRNFGGTGLGLSICRDLVRLMGGEIELASQVGVGSTFIVRLPLPEGAKPVLSDVSTGTSHASETLEGGLRVLAAEDNQVNQLVLGALLGQMGVEPCFVWDGAEAVEAWRREPWDLILMDAQMPVMDGREATRLIRAEEAQSARARTPIIALTANALTHQAAEYLACGMDQVVAKPIEVHRLVEAINQVLDPFFNSPDNAVGAA
ncbi:MAG: ATP-binding protein [Phenylobacterium sp.]|uniref:hybrid sensor histidine kinase/response regulator n=1 Tax=Phenylobacterium sp. TaxID=1871053 RepID=UPI0025D58AE6|nr:ATP-binding protein [Phenylobacterium sp.]MCG9916057.1 ATP-binding protein [Phenylobacterium sp.]